MVKVDEAVQEFLTESYEALDNVDGDLVLLERDPASPSLISSLFRAIHTIKGTAGFFDFSRTARIAHTAEDLLSLVREGQRAIDPQVINVLLRTSDTLRGVLVHIEANGVEPDGDDTRLLAQLTALQGDAAAVPEAEEVGDLVEDASAAPAPTPADPPRPAELEPAPPSTSGPSEIPRAAATTVRVSVEVLDRLMTLASELVLVRNQIVQHNATVRDSVLQGNAQRLNVITTELQETVMKSRMQEIGSILSKLPRAARDVATECGRLVRLELEGQETEVDRTLLEAIKDPIGHLLRNAIDHGIEPPERRLSAGKPAEGLIRLRAYHAGGRVNIEMTDDGRGIDPARVVEKAIERGIITAEQSARLGASELVNLIFLPGFSTAEKVSSISGRGVGMDVVRTNIERVGGTVTVESTLGSGTTVRLQVPLTLAILPALICRAAGGRYAVPRGNLRSVISVSRDDQSRRVEYVYGAPVLWDRGALVPIVCLARILEREARPLEEGALVVIVEVEGRRFGLVVDEVCDTEEIVVKPLGPRLGSSGLFAGATVLGDGMVALVLDVRGLGHRSGALGVQRARAPDVQVDRGAAGVGGRPRESFLLLGLGGDERVALRLSEVSRLEDLEPTAVQTIGGRRVLQYGREIMPLLELSELVGRGGGDGRGRSVVVCVHEGRPFGLIADAVLDVVDGELPAFAGAAMIQDRATELVDVPALLSSYASQLFGVPS